LDWDGKTAVPLLAKSWTISPDGKLYTFKLRDDVQFCSGKKFTAADVVYSFNRQKDPAKARPMPGAPARSRNCARPIPTRWSTNWSSRIPTCWCSSPCSTTASTTRRAWTRWARTTASRASTAPAPGAS
jgi:ABC-type transport system substrate-binding protein